MAPESACQYSIEFRDMWFGQRCSRASSNTVIYYFPEVRFRKETVISLRQCYDTDNFLSGKVEFFPEIQLSLIRFLLLLVASPPSVLTTLKKCRKMSCSLRTPLLQPRLNILSVRLYHRLEQDKSYRVWYRTLCRQETWAPTSWLLRCLLVTRAMGRMGSQEKEKLRIRTKK